MIRQLIAGWLLGLAVVALWLLLSDHAITAPLRTWWRPIGVAAVCVIAFAAVIALLSAGDRRSPALLRLDWFLPQLRRLRAGEQANSRWLGRLLQRILPSSFSSDRSTKKRGLIRRWLRRLGISWLASPPRRVIQATCLIVFLCSFFYICWPYDAQPAPPAQVSRGWRLTQLDQATGEISLSRTINESWLAEQRDELFLGLEQDAVTVAAPCPVVAHSATAVTLRVDAEFPDDLFDALLTGTDSWLVCDTDPNAWPSHYADNLAAKEKIAAELFLAIDPLVSLSTAIASRSWVWSLACAAIILLVCLLIPRGFCGYLCPLGTTIDLFDWADHAANQTISGSRRRLVGPRQVLFVGWNPGGGDVRRSGVRFRGGDPRDHTRVAVCRPIRSKADSPVVGIWSRRLDVGQVVSIALFFAVLCLGFLRPRFWCKYVCPSGAVFSFGNLFRITERQVESSCIHCNKCVEICPFDAIKPDFTTRETDCTMCQSCGGVCPTHAIKFVERWNVVELKVENDPPTNETAIGPPRFHVVGRRHGCGNGWRAGCCRRARSCSGQT